MKIHIPFLNRYCFIFLLVLFQTGGMSAQQNLPEALDQLTEVYQVNFIYDSQQLDLQLPKNYACSKKNIEKDLERLLDPNNLFYKRLNDNTYVIKAREGKIDPKVNSPKPTKISGISKPIEKVKVSGVIYDREENETLIGVNITTDSGTGTVSDLDGKFTLMTEKGSTLSFSYIGYMTQNIRIDGEKTFDIFLEKDAALLEEVVVVGYGSQKRSDLTGSLSRVSEVELKQLPNTGLEQAIQGRSAGVYVTQNSGAPGGGLSIRIRGTGSTISAEPLYVIDGIPVINDNQGTSATFENDGGGQYSNALTTINPNDIESIEILKDASATAIYGSRAANGVVLISTKRGKKGQSNLNYDAYVGMQQLYRRIPMMSLREYSEYLTDINLAEGFEEFERPELLGEGTDWQKEIFRNALMYNHQMTLTAGTEKTRFSLAGGLHKKDGIVRGSSFERYSLKINADHAFSDKVNIGGNILASRTKEDITFNDNSNGVIYTALLTPPMIPARNLDGSFGTPSGDVVLTFNNPLANALETEDINRKNRILASVYGEIQILPWLKYRTELATDILYANHNTFWPQFDRGNVQQRSRVRRNNNNSFFWINKQLITLNTTFREDHSFNLLLGFEAQEGRYEWLYAARDNLPTNDLRQLTLGDAGTQVNNGGAGHWALLSGFTRLNYGYKDRYLITSTFRADGSSRFGPENRFGFFPSAAFAWRASNEAFLENADALTNLKVRLGYGAVGNQEIGLYSFASTIRSQDVAFGDVLISGFIPDNISNPEVKWESSEQVNFGVDLGLFNNRLEIILDVYNKDSKDMLLPAIFPSTAGSLNPPFINIGEMNNRGFEFTVNTQNFAGKFNWKTSANLSINRNEVVDLGSTGALTGVVQRVPVTRTIEGQPIAQFFGHQVEGIFQSLEEIAASAVQEAGTRPGDLKFKDLNNDNIINDLDRTFIGNPNPDFTINMINDLSYKNFDLNFFFRGVFGNEVYNLLRRDIAGTGAWHNQSVAVVDRWSVDNPNGTEPKPDGNDPNRNRRVSDRFIEDGSFIRLQNVTLGYNMPQTLCKKLRMKSFRVYISGQNLFTASEYSGYDPEIGSFNQNPLINGLDNGRFPIARSFTFGLNANL